MRGIAFAAVVELFLLAVAVVPTANGLWTVVFGSGRSYE